MPPKRVNKEPVPKKDQKKQEAAALTVREGDQTPPPKRRRLTRAASEVDVEDVSPVSDMSASESDTESQLSHLETPVKEKPSVAAAPAPGVLPLFEVPRVSKGGKFQAFIDKKTHKVSFTAGTERAIPYFFIRAFQPVLDPAKIYGRGTLGGFTVAVNDRTHRDLLKMCKAVEAVMKEYHAEGDWGAQVFRDSQFDCAEPVTDYTNNVKMRLNVAKTSVKVWSASGCTDIISNADKLAALSQTGIEVLCCYVSGEVYTMKRPSQYCSLHVDSRMWSARYSSGPCLRRERNCLLGPSAASANLFM